MSLTSNKYSGNHQDVPTYGLDRLNRTPSDTTTYEHYKEVHKTQVEPATIALSEAKNKAPLKGKQPATSHVAVAKAARELESGAHK